MSHTIAEAHGIFLREHEDIDICRSKFYSLRPCDVFPASEKDQEVCVCPICENCEFMTKAVGLGPPKTVDVSTISSLLWPDNISFNKYVKGELEKASLPKERFFSELTTSLKNYQNHIDIKNKQSEQLRNQKASITEGKDIIVTADFAEDYSIKYAEEPMEKHWKSMPGVKIFTSVVYYRFKGELVSKSYAVISDALNNTTTEMAVFLDAIIRDLKDCGIEFSRKIFLWTDGAAKHFKNRYAMAYLTHFQSIYGTSGEWNFHESYHGKGPMDGMADY